MSRETPSDRMARVTILVPVEAETPPIDFQIVSNGGDYELEQISDADPDDVESVLTVLVSAVLDVEAW